MYKIVEFSHILIKEHFNRINKNDITFIDATCGRGSDTIFMAKLLQNRGYVFSYDIQEEAINYTQNLLNLENINNVTLKLKSHEFIDEDDIDLVVFNLGYLPGGDKTITTKADTTIKCLKKMINRIAINDDLLIIVVLYPGHEEGKIESDLIDNYLYNLSSKEYLVCKYLNYNRPTSPYILTISKNK